jgi:hypothetical protein
MLHIAPKSFLKSWSRLGDPGTDKWSCVFVFLFGLLCPCVADSLPGPHGWSVTSRLTRCSSCSLRVLLSLLFDPFCLVLLVAWSLTDSSRGECGQSSLRGRSAVREQTVRYSRCSTKSSGGFSGWSTLCLRSVRLTPANSPPLPRGRSARGCVDCLSPLRLELRFCVTLSWGLFLGLVGPLWLRDLGKLVWESLVVNLGHRPSSSFGKNFYRLPFTPPSLVAQSVLQPRLFFSPLLHSHTLFFHTNFVPLWSNNSSYIVLTQLESNRMCPMSLGSNVATKAS